MHENSKQYSYFLFCDEDSRVNLSLLQSEVLNKFANSSQKPLFAGHGLFDKEATIIHHFAFYENPREFFYPDFSACFLLNFKMIELILNPKIEVNNDFSIDAKHELAKIIFDRGYKLNAINDKFCNNKIANNDSCVTWYNWSTPNCQKKHNFVNNKNVVFGVKTFSGYHSERIPYIKRSWFKETHQHNVKFFSDIEDLTIPTIRAGDNTEAGHCSKMFFIFDYYIKYLATNYHYLVICDDDTLFNVKRLFDMISCYAGSKRGFVIGERYGFSVNKIHPNSFGFYNYPTGGAGIVFSRKAVEEIAKSCECPSDDTPDDMYLGSCMQNLKIDFIHSDLMHQARPFDYSADYLLHQKAISFHKFWNCDPVEVYNNWLSDSDTISTRIHNEL